MLPNRVTENEPKDEENEWKGNKPATTFTKRTRESIFDETTSRICYRQARGRKRSLGAYLLSKRKPGYTGFEIHVSRVDINMQEDIGGVARPRKRSNDRGRAATSVGNVETICVCLLGNIEISPLIFNIGANAKIRAMYMQ